MKNKQLFHGFFSLALLVSSTPALAQETCASLVGENESVVLVDKTAIAVPQEKADFLALAPGQRASVVAQGRPVHVCYDEFRNAQTKQEDFLFFIFLRCFYMQKGLFC